MQSGDFGELGERNVSMEKATFFGEVQQGVKD